MRTPPRGYRIRAGKGSQPEGDLAVLDSNAFAGRYASVKRFVWKLCGSSAPEVRVVIETAPNAEAKGGLWLRADGARSGERQVSADASLRDDAGAQLKIGCSDRARAELLGPHLGALCQAIH